MRRLALVAALSAVFGLGISMAVAQHHAHSPHHGHVQPSGDARVLVKLPPDLEAHTLANMRDHLAALKEVNDALAAGKADLAAKVAEERLGMASLALHGAHEIAKFMPQGMQEAGTAMHRSASRFAIEAQNAAVTGDLKAALGALGEVMSACVGCHAGYRLR